MSRDDPDDRTAPDDRAAAAVVDADRAAILARRQRFIAIALSGLASSAACTKSSPQPCLNQPVPQDSASPTACLEVAPPVEPTPPQPTPVEPTPPQPCLDVAPPQACLKVAAPDPPEPTPPQPCLRVAKPEPKASPRPCLDVAPPDDGGPRPCLSVRKPK